MKLIDLAKVIRSKNAGPTTLTLDLLFNDAAGFRLACASKSLSPDAIARLYSQPPAKAANSASVTAAFKWPRSRPQPR